MIWINHRIREEHSWELCDPRYRSNNHLEMVRFWRRQSWWYDSTHKQWTPTADNPLKENSWIKKLTIKESVALLYTNGIWSKKEIKGTIPYTKATNNMTYLEVTLIKQVKDPMTRTSTYQNQSTNSLKSPSKLQHNFLQTLKNN